MESVLKNIVFGLQMLVNSGLEKIFLKFLHAGDCFSLLFKSVQYHKFSKKKQLSSRMEEFEDKFFQTTFHHHF